MQMEMGQNLCVLQPSVTASTVGRQEETAARRPKRFYKYVFYLASSSHDTVGR